MTEILSRETRILQAILVLLASAIPLTVKPQSLQDRISRDIAVLYGGDDKNQADAVSDLVKIGKSSIPSLLEVLNNDRRRDFERAYRPAAAALGELKAAEAAPRLCWLLGTGDSAMIMMEGKTDESLAALDPAFGPIVKIGDPALAELKKELSVGSWNKRYLILRALHSIGTPDSLSLGNAYIGTLESELRITGKLFTNGSSAP